MTAEVRKYVSFISGRRIVELDAEGNFLPTSSGFCTTGVCDSRLRECADFLNTRLHESRVSQCYFLRGPRLVMGLGMV